MATAGIWPKRIPVNGMITYHYNYYTLYLIQKWYKINKQMEPFMYKKRIITIIVGNALAAALAFSFTACSGKNKSYDYTKLLKGDLSEFAGNWKAGYSNLHLKANGTYGDFIRNSNITLEDGKYYTWSLSNNKDYDDIEMFLYPAGVDIIEDGEVIQSDKKKVRLLAGKYIFGVSDVFYLEATDVEIASAEAIAYQTALSEGYSKLLYGDFSQFTAGYWTQGSSGIQLRADGTFKNGVTASSARRNDDGAYFWNMYDKKDGGGWGAVLYPVGVEVKSADGVIIQTDTTKVRLAMGQDGPMSNDEIYYYQERSGGVYYATTTVRLRSEPETGKDNRIASIPKGGSVELLETGKTETIDDMTAPWYKVKTANGTIGWVFSGYLSQTK